eukprot:216976_1
MAQAQVVATRENGEEEGIGLSELETSTLKQYLNKENLLSVYNKLASNGFTEISTLSHMNEDELSELCVALELTLMEALKFKPSIRKYKQIYKKQHKQQQINEEIKIVETKICQSFDSIIKKLNSRKIKLLKQLHKNKSNKHINMQYSPCNECELIQCINKFGIIKNSNNNIEKPDICALINRKNNKIQIDVRNEDTKNIKSLEIYYRNRNKTEPDDDEKLDDWKVIKTDSFIDNIQPLNQYDIRARYMNSNGVWSNLSTTITIDTKFECIWNEHPHKNNKYITFNSDNELIFNKYCDTVSVICDDIIKSDNFSKIKFEFIINEFCQSSQFGFISAINPINKTMNGYWNYKNISYNKDAFILEAMDGNSMVHRYQNGKDTDCRLFSNPGILIQSIIKQGDHFIFDVDFDALICNVFIHSDQNSIWISNKPNMPTFANIPSIIIPVYSHCKETKLIARSSRVKIKLLR